MRISDWSSDVCSSDLRYVRRIGQRRCDIRAQPCLRRLIVQKAAGIDAADAAAFGQADIPDPPGGVRGRDRLRRDRASRRHRHLRGERAVVEQHIARSEEHTSELQSLMRISYAVFCLKKKNTTDSESYEAEQYITHVEKLTQ